MTESCQIHHQNKQVDVETKSAELLTQEIKLKGHACFSVCMYVCMWVGDTKWLTTRIARIFIPVHL